MTTYDQNCTVTHYVAEDGKDFLSRFDCLEYEHRIRSAKYVREAERLRQFELYPPIAEDSGMLATWYLLKGPSDLETIKNAFYCHDCTANDFECASYPAWVVAVIDSERYGWIESYDGYVKLLEEHLAKLKEKVGMA